MSSEQITFEKKSPDFEMLVGEVEKRKNKNMAAVEGMSPRSKSRKLIERMLKKAAPFVLVGASLLSIENAAAQGMGIKDDMAKTEAWTDDPYPIDKAQEQELPLHLDVTQQGQEMEPLATTEEIHATVAKQTESFVREASKANFWETIKDAPLEQFLNLPEGTDARIIAFSDRVKTIIAHAQALGYNYTPNTTVMQGIENAFYMGFTHETDFAHPQE